MNATPNVEITSLIKPLVDGFKIINNEWDNFLKIGLEDYLHSQTEKYYFTNTFLHRSEKVRFNDIYYPIKASYKDLRTDFLKLDVVFEEYKKITIIGSAGSGKTTLIKNIFLKCVSEKKKIPILIELRNLNEYDGNFEKLISEKVLKSKIKPSDTIFKRTLESGKFLFLLDGYDEIFSEKKQEINRQLELFVDSYPNNYFLITTRPGSGIETFSRFYDFKVNSLSNEDVIGFISKIIEDNERKDRLIKIINDPSNSSYFEYLRNPLLLSMFIMASESHPEIPKRKSAFYRNVFDTLYSKHDGITKNSFPREKLSRLERDNFENILSVFSYLSMMEGQFTFTHEYLSDILLKVKDYTQYNYKVEDLISDLRTTISILILDGFEYYFPHRSMQEYFTAFFISNLPTNKKQKAYNNLSQILQNSSTDYSFNFWSLCFELDEDMFIKNFLMPQLKKILKRIDKSNDYDSMIEFFKILRPVLYKDNISDGEKILLVRHASFINSILDFCDVYDYKSLILNFPQQSNAKRFLDIYHSLDSEDGRNFFEVSKHQHIIEVLIEYNFAEIINKVKTSLKKKISIWEHKIELNKKNIDDLLKL